MVWEEVMGLFSKNKNGLMDAIRCDEQDYLIWKWHPNNGDPNDPRANAIRWGSSLNVRDGSVAVFVYRQEDGTMQDYIEGPYNGLIETKNLPVLAKIIGKAYNGATPFQAEIYFINLAGQIQLKFGVPYFDIFDPEFPDYGVPVSVRGSINFTIDDYIAFIKKFSLVSFNLEDFKSRIQSSLINTVKKVVLNAPEDLGLRVVQIERHIDIISEAIEEEIEDDFDKEYAVYVTAVNVEHIEINKESAGYKKLYSMTQNAGVTFLNAVGHLKTAKSSRKTGRKNILKTDKENNAHSAQKEDKDSIGDLMAGLLGKALGGNKQQKGVTPPPIPITVYYVAIGAEQTGPFDMETLAKMVQGGSITKETLVWKEGMENWKAAGEVEEFSKFF